MKHILETDERKFYVHYGYHGINLPAENQNTNNNN